MCSAEELATAQCASCQPRCRTLRPLAGPASWSTGSVTVRAGARVLGAAEGVGVVAAPTSAPAGCSASRPKSRTSAARTASGPAARVPAGRPSQVSVAAE